MNYRNRIQHTIDELKARLQVDFVSVATAETHLGHAVKEIKWEYVSGNQSNGYQKIRLQIGRGIGGIVWRTGRPYMETGLQDKRDKWMAYPIVRTEKLEAVYAIPLLAEEKVIGVLIIGYRVNQDIPAPVREEVDQSAETLASLLEAIRDGQ